MDTMTFLIFIIVLAAPRWRMVRGGGTNPYTVRTEL
jgi:hypothetical protein